MGAKSIRMVWQRMMLSRFIMFTVKSIRGIFYRRYRQGAPALLKHHCLTCVNCRYKGVVASYSTAANPSSARRCFISRDLSGIFTLIRRGKTCIGAGHVVLREGMLVEKRSISWRDSCRVI